MNKSKECKERNSNSQKFFRKQKIGKNTYNLNRKKTRFKLM